MHHTHSCGHGITFSFHISGWMLWAWFYLLVFPCWTLHLGCHLSLVKSTLVSAVLQQPLGNGKAEFPEKLQIQLASSFQKCLFCFKKFSRRALIRAEAYCPFPHTLPIGATHTS